RLPERADAIAMDQRGAALLHLRVGSTLAMEAMRSDVGAGIAAGDPAGVRKLRERVVGIIVTRSSVKPVAELDKIPTIVASTALMRKLGPHYASWAAVEVKLEPGTDLDGFRRRADALARLFPGQHGQGQMLVADRNAQAATVERTIRPEAVALALFALALALTSFLIIGQVATRILAAAAADNPVLAALGMTRRQLAWGRLAAVVVAAAAGAVAAAGVAVAVSPLMPIGSARLAEPAPGVTAA